MKAGRRLLGGERGWLALALIVGCSEPPDVPLGSGNPLETVEQSADEGDWPRWRGPRGDGVSLEKRWTTEWPDAGPPRLWQADVGIGYSAVSVSNNRAYTMGNVDGDDIVYCLNAETGDEIWRHAYPCKLNNVQHAGGPSATPTIVDGRVYTFSKAGDLICLDAAGGRVHWSTKVTDVKGAEVPDWGYSGSALVVGDKVIVDAGPTVAYRVSDGKLLWKTDAYRAGYGTPVAFQSKGQTLVAVLNNQFLMVVAAEDGSQVARYAWKTFSDTSSCTPVITDDSIFVSAGYDDGRAMLLQLHGDSIRRVWKNKDMQCHFSTAVYWQGHLYGFDGTSWAGRNVKLVCMEQATGKVKWSVRGDKGYRCGSLMIADGKLVIMSETGELVIAEADPTGHKVIARTSVFEDARCWTVPVLSHGRIYCREDKGKLVCLDLKRSADER